MWVNPEANAIWVTVVPDGALRIRSRGTLEAEQQRVLHGRAAVAAVERLLQMARRHPDGGGPLAQGDRAVQVLQRPVDGAPGVQRERSAGIVVVLGKELLGAAGQLEQQRRQQGLLQGFHQRTRGADGPAEDLGGLPPREVDEGRGGLEGVPGTDVDGTLLGVTGKLLQVAVQAGLGGRDDHGPLARVREHGGLRVPAEHRPTVVLVLRPFSSNIASF